MVSAHLLEYFFWVKLKNIHSYIIIWPTKKELNSSLLLETTKVLNTLVHSNTLVSSRAVLKFINFVDAR